MARTAKKGDKRRRQSEQAALAEAQRAGRGDDDMVEQRDLDRLQGVADAAGHVDIGPGRLRVARGVLGCIRRCKRHWSRGGDFLD